MKRILFLLLLAAPLALNAQRANVQYVDQFSGKDVATKTTAAQAACTPNIPCVVIFDAVLAAYSRGVLPSRCANCLWIDFTSNTGVSFNPPLTGNAAPLVTNPGYFFPTITGGVLDAFDYGNFDPRGGGLSLCTNWKQFYLPFDITINTYRFQIDASAVDSAFYAGLYDNSGALLFDIGRIALNGGAGLFGPGAVHDTGTVFFDSGRNPISVITLKSGWYYYGWGAEGGSITFPTMGPANGTALWGEIIGTQPTGTAVSARWGHSSAFDITSGHLPLTIRTIGGVASNSPNIVFYAQ